MIKIAVDAMGSDHAPAVEVDGAVQAAAQYGVPIVLVGQESAVRPLLEKHDVTGLPIEIVHASEVITMEDSAATAVRRKKDSSIRVAENLMRDGKVSGVVSAGNTGAVMATAKFVVGTLPVVDRPALSTVLPTQKGKPCILLDVGANVDCKPLHLEQFAIMGDIYSRAIFGIRRPRVGLAVHRRRRLERKRTHEGILQGSAASRRSTSSATSKAATFSRAMSTSSSVTDSPETSR